jgi:hypothetical protein
MITDDFISYLQLWRQPQLLTLITEIHCLAYQQQLFEWDNVINQMHTLYLLEMHISRPITFQPKKAAAKDGLLNILKYGKLPAMWEHQNDINKECNNKKGSSQRGSSHPTGMHPWF